ncbi:hypothetical protein NL676_003544 [Syzygium grande]|nr:hypothetical protein NL676_003544 [Syzygium grande]
MIVDLNAGWALEVAERMGIERAGFWPASVSALVLTLHFPKLIKGGLVDNNGFALKNDLIKISKDLPSYKSNDLIWSCPEDPATQKAIFKFVLSVVHHSKRSNSFLCNSFYELEASAFSVIPGALPIEARQYSARNNSRSLPMASNRLPDHSCGSYGPTSLTGQSMSSMMGSFKGPEQWSPTSLQALFWRPVPEQELRDVWRVALGVDGGENGVTTRHEVRTKMLAVHGSDEIRANCLRVKEMAKKSVSEGVPP